MSSKAGGDIVPFRDVMREVYARLAEGEIISTKETEAIGPHALPELRARASRNHRQLTEEGTWLRLVLPPLHDRSR